MRRSMVIALLMILSLAVAGGLSAVFAATVEVRSDITLPLKGEGRAIALSANGKELFVLVAGGRINIYSNAGHLLGSIKVSASATDIAVSPDGSKLYVSEGTNKLVRVLTLDRIVKFDPAPASFVTGPSNAPVTIVVFNDFQCPFCAKLNPILKQVLDKYPMQVKLVYKFSPLVSIHKMSMQAAIAAQAAAKQGKFWEYHDALLSSYNNLSEAKFLEIGEELGLDMLRFARERKDPRFINLIRKDIREAGEHQINSVPTAFVNGRKVTRRSLETFDRLIKSELARKVEKQ